MRSFVLVLAVTAVAAGFLAAGADAQCQGLVPDLEAAAGQYGISQFVNVLKDIGFSGNPPYTIFAPTDDAIAGATKSLGVSGGPSTWTPQQKYIITQVALYHVAPGNLPSSGISKFGASVSTVASNLRLCTGDKTIAGDKNITDNFNSLTLKVSGKTITVMAGANTATITQPDIKIKCQPNIVIHKIDRVLLPCDFTKFLKEPLPSPVVAPSPKAKAQAPGAAKCAKGSTVFKALGGTLAGSSVLPSLLRPALQPNFVGTVFVPSDTSIMALAKSLGASEEALGVLAKSTIFAELLSYHIVPTTVYNPTTPGATTLKTLLASNSKQTFCAAPSPGTLTATATGSSVTIKAGADSAKVVSSVVTCTGTIHIIDAVLLPCPPPANIQALIKSAKANHTTGTTGMPDMSGTASPAPDTVSGTAPGGSRSVSLVGNSSATNSTPATSKKSAAAAFTPSALLALVAAFLMAAQVL